MNKTEQDNICILNYLEGGGVLTPNEALRLFDVHRLSGRIMELKRRGNPIEMRIIETTDGKRVAEYFIKKGNQSK